MDDAERTAGDFTYIDNFKLLLQWQSPAVAPAAGRRGGRGGWQQRGQGSGAGASGEVEAEDLLPALPPGLTAVQVVADFLTELRGYIFRHLVRCAPAHISAPASSSPLPLLDGSHIGWCLTVPAMWDEAAKSRLRQAANRAGMATAADPAALQMILEPEAAALAAAVLQVPPAAAPAAAATSTARKTGGGGAAVIDEAVEVHLRRIDAAERSDDAASSAVTAAAATARSGPKAGPAPAPAASLCEGDVLLVMDCGGGTADVTLHRVRGAGAGLRLEEAAEGRGVPAGGRFVDAAAWSYLRSELGGGAWDGWRAAHVREWAQLAGSWEAAKRFPGPVSLQLPPALLAAVAAGARKPRGRPRSTMLGLGRRSAAGGAGGPLRPDGVFVLREEVLEARVVGPVVGRIIAAAEKVLREGARAGSAATKVLLTGGLANSAALQRRAASMAASHGAQLLLPRSPSASVVTGAVLFGQLPARVSARRCRLSYGVMTATAWSSAHEDSHRERGYPGWILDDEGERLADDVFKQFVHRGQLVETDEVVVHTFSPIYRSEQSVAFRMYATESSTASYTVEPGMREVAEVELELPADWRSKVQSRHDYKLEAELRFGATEITLLARDLHTRNAVATTLSWTSDPVSLPAV
ncbi:hypothetical protein GPECTOR_13g672 [Gonium pectorale]|uniref:Uncharacterized protein n=1 Tax=Gonium pectorale TaxID=33097 RepID=A0A150GN29_GONPE|nr:hypothetical protein GPECTOR_13g672 [Gonium pectorale]|eukprot:KXZ51185.1 hypothetical protein GPECTOR_13g672 [Gonium pectorale]